VEKCRVCLAKLFRRCFLLFGRKSVLIQHKKVKVALSVLYFELFVNVFAFLFFFFFFFFLESKRLGQKALTNKHVISS